jgi:predicted alpha/beta hydrolase family esterase
MKRVIFVHRWSGGPLDDWRPWLKDELEQRGYKVINPEMPDMDTPVIEKWIGKLRDVVGTPDTDTYFIGHSIGCQAILRYLETIDAPVDGAVFVAGWFDLKNLEDEEVIQTAKPWIETPINASKIEKVLTKSVLIISQDDPYDSYDMNIKRFTEFMSRVVVLPHTGHITETKEPAVLSQFLNLAE